MIKRDIKPRSMKNCRDVGNQIEKFQESYPSAKMLKNRLFFGGQI
jgi:hypothetical protein